MKIGLVGYGRMGKEIEKIALERGHSVPMIIDVDNSDDFTPENLAKCDVVIEFTVPSSAVNNYLKCFNSGVPVVSGTTGWLHEKEMIYEACLKNQGTFFYASNFSVGVNLFFELNRKLSRLMGPYSGYQVGIREIHHVMKLDAPSGTAITLAEDLVREMPEKKGWCTGPSGNPSEIGVVSERRGEVPGIHTITWESDDDVIEIAHSAKNRRGFALGAVLAAEFCLTRKGIFNMNDLLNL